MKSLDFLRSYKRRKNLLTRCKIPDFRERYKKDIGIYDDKSKRILHRSVKQRDKCLYSHNNHYSVIWQKKRKDALLIGLEETNRNFKYFKNKINKYNISHRIRYRFPKHKTKDQLENVFIFDFETSNDEELAEAYAAVLYDENHLRDKWDRDLGPDEIVTEKDNIFVFDTSNENCK